MNKESLTLEELQELAGKPVYCPEIEAYGIVKCETIGIWAGVPFLRLGLRHDAQKFWQFLRQFPAMRP